jgi:hypothetical protein
MVEYHEPTALADCNHKGDDMKQIVALGLLAGCLSVLGCTSEPKKAPMPQPTYKDVRSDSDRFFDKVKQDEAEHGNKMKETMP